jgi:hypothetical protein
MFHNQYSEMLMLCAPVTFHRDTKNRLSEGGRLTAEKIGS